MLVFDEGHDSWFPVSKHQGYLSAVRLKITIVLVLGEGQGM